jgi:SMC interacting uncharacterized protein involved in chromosome segregation
MRKKEKDLIDVLEKMQTYVTLAEQEIETRKKESESLRKELSASRIVNLYRVKYKYSIHRN